MQSYGNPDVTYGWWVGNSVVTNRAGRFIGSHIGHTGIICFATGASTLWELARYNPEIPMGHQSSIFLAHLASLGLGFDEAGVWTGVGVSTIAGLILIPFIGLVGAAWASVIGSATMYFFSHVLSNSKFDKNSITLAFTSFVCSLILYDFLK